MAVGVLSGTANDRGTTNNVDAQRLVIDMRDEIQVLEPDASPLTTLLMHPDFGTRDAKSTKIEWPEAEDLPAITVAAASFLIGAGSFAVAAGTGAYFKGGDLIRNDLTGEVMRVDSVATDTLTVTRGIGNGGTGVASVGSADTIVRLNNASISGGTLPAIRMAKVVFNFNYCQIQREHKKALERALFWGKRDLKTDSAVSGTAGYPQYMAGGLVSYITSNITNLAGAALSTTNLEAALRPIFRYGSGRRIAFCSPIAFSALANFSLSKLASPAGSGVYGVKAKQYITGAGDELFLVLKRDWLDYPVGSASTNTPTGGHMVIVDPDYINLAWFRPTGWLPDRQAPDADAQTGEYLTQYSLEVLNGGSSGGSGNGVHGIIRGFSA
jgi:hypothetical protein